MEKVTFETKCWEGDWEILLKTDYLFKQIRNCDYHFSVKRLIINNVENHTEVEKWAKKAVENGIITEYAFVSDYEQEVLTYFNLTKEEIGKGYCYTIAELVGIYLCTTKYLLHFSSDTRIEKIWKNNFIKDGIELMENNGEVAVVNPMWNYSFKSLKKPNYDPTKRFHIGNGFSDQCYLIRTDEFKKDIYHFEHETGKGYPEYGGELFEKRCNAYLRCNNRRRAVYLKSSYWSNNLRGLSNYLKEDHDILKKIAHIIKYKLYIR